MYYNRYKNSIDLMSLKSLLGIVRHMLRSCLYHLLFVVILHISRLLLSFYI